MIDSRKDFSVTGERITFKEYDEMTNDYVDIQKQDMLKDGIKLIFTPPPLKKKEKSFANIDELSRSVENCEIYYLKEERPLNCTLRS